MEGVVEGEAGGAAEGVVEGAASGGEAEDEGEADRDGGGVSAKKRRASERGHAQRGGGA